MLNNLSKKGEQILEKGALKLINSTVPLEYPKEKRHD